ncbi:uncharacterized protein LOC121388415 [Gigantopelta aegis]|uniref:uncharacterized protein LOC121388415 n=1 Tax=Gigantopelta aegis TaxID=1735272 RepID=UPI001B88C17B|nr:uncharacterized protein LOC121388415 [Gigantopelta aegis]
MEPVFILPADRTKHMWLANKPKAEVVALILEHIDEICNTGAVDVADSLMNAYKADVKKGAKDVLLTFLKDATQVYDTFMDVFQCSTPGFIRLCNHILRYKEPY